MVESSKETKDSFSKKQIVLFIVLSLFIGGSLFYIGNAYYYSQIDNIPITKKSTIINGTVKKTLQIKGSVKVWFNNGEIILIYTGSNENYEKIFLTNFLKQNDSISKNYNSDTVFIYRANNKYFFLLNKSIEKENKKTNREEKKHN